MGVGLLSWFYLMLHFLSYNLESARIVRAEIRSLRHRIGVLLDKKSRFDRLGLGPLYTDGPDGHLRLCAETQGRTLGIESVLATQPWASAGDVLFFLQGWKMGSEWLRCSSDIENTHTVQPSICPERCDGNG
jgi:hypothetical protein